MIICPSCGNPMRYITGEKNGNKYEFFGCVDWPNCKRCVQVGDAQKYDDGIQPKRTIEEEAADLRATLLSDGWSYAEASEAYKQWIKEK